MKLWPKQGPQAPGVAGLRDGTGGGPQGLRCQAAQVQQIRTVLKNSVAMIETPEWRIFLMKDLATVEEAQRQGGKAGRGGGEVLGAICRRARRKRVKFERGPS